MPIEYDIIGIEADSKEFRMSSEAVDMESVKERTLKRIAEKMAGMVRQAVFESSIKSPASKISPYESGDGPALATIKGSQPAWIVKRDSNNRYEVLPHPKVRQRAIVLNYGYPGKIEPKGDFLRFTVNGIPVFSTEVDGPEKTGYWNAAYRRMENSGELRKIANEELDREFEEKFR